MVGKEKPAPGAMARASGVVLAAERDSREHTTHTDDRQAGTEAREAVEPICEVRDWLEHSATIMERLIAREQDVWKDEPGGGAPDLTLTMEQAQGLAEGIRTASENLNGAVSVLLGLEREAP